MEKNYFHAVIVGGGAAGVFAAISLLEAFPKANILLLEKSQQLLSKVKISGGGRCNVTHSCFDPKELVKNYPRGMKELLGPFTRYQPRDVIAWFKNRGVLLKTEEDGRMFPTTDSSQTIIDCLLKAAGGVHIERGKSVDSILREKDAFVIKLKSAEMIRSGALLLATGSASQGHSLAKGLGHSIVDPVPSLFTFNVPDSPLISLAGIAVEKAEASLPELKTSQTGPLLITHWGFSGPAVLKLSAFSARELNGCGYHTPLQIDWRPDYPEEELKNFLVGHKQMNPGKKVLADPLFQLPKNLWKALLENEGIGQELSWGRASKGDLAHIIQKLKRDRYQISGKTTYKQEFVTCGGVRLSEVNFQTMESKLAPGLYFAGEILDLDGITGGFNFQAAWTTGWLAANAMAKGIEA